MATAHEVPRVLVAVVAVLHALPAISNKVTFMLTVNRVLGPTTSPAPDRSVVKFVKQENMATQEATYGMRAAAAQIAHQGNTVQSAAGTHVEGVRLASGRTVVPGAAMLAQLENTKPAADASPTLEDITVDQAALDTPHVPVGGTQQVPSPKPMTAPYAPVAGTVQGPGALLSAAGVHRALPVRGPAVG